MTSAAMTPIPNKNLVRLLTTVSPTHLPTLLNLWASVLEPMLMGPSSLPISVRPPQTDPALFSLSRTSFADKGWGRDPTSSGKGLAPLLHALPPFSPPTPAGFAVKRAQPRPWR